MGHLTRTHNWAQTTLGPPDTWPQSLRTTLGIMLHSAFPMFLFWGDELTCFYNDAYRPSLGNAGKHPAVGQPGKAVWPEIWDFIGPHIKQVMITGEPVWFEDQLVPIYRNDRREDMYWTFSYSPAFGDNDQIAGMLVTCTETTDKVNAATKLQTSDQLFQNIVRDASVGMIVLSGEAMRVDIVNDAYARLIDRRCDELLGKDLFSIIPDAEAVFRPIIDNVRQTGEPLYLYGQPYSVRNADGMLITGFLNLIYQPYKEADGTITGVAVHCQDITGQKKAEEALRLSEERQTFLLQLSDRLRTLTDSADIQYKAACALGEYIGASRFGYAEDMQDGQTIVVTRNYTNGVPGIEGRYRYEDYGASLMAELQVGRTVIRPDIANDPTLTKAEKQAHAQLQLGATLNKPLVKNGRLVAVLFLHYDGPTPFRNRN